MAEQFILCSHQSYKPHIKSIAFFIHNDDWVEVARVWFMDKGGDIDITRLKSGMSFLQVKSSRPWKRSWDKSEAELGIIGDNSTNWQRINRTTLSIVGYRLALETALSVCCLKTKSDDRQIELSVRTINKYNWMIIWRKIVWTMLSIYRFKRKNSQWSPSRLKYKLQCEKWFWFWALFWLKNEGLKPTLSNDRWKMKGWNRPCGMIC
jgi:hypothetical protein